MAFQEDAFQNEPTHGLAAFQVGEGDVDAANPPKYLHFHVTTGKLKSF